MTRIYIPYGTTEGQTAKIADYIADVMRATWATKPTPWTSSMPVTPSPSGATR